MFEDMLGRRIEGMKTEGAGAMWFLLDDNTLIKVYANLTSYEELVLETDTIYPPSVASGWVMYDPKSE